MTEQTKACGRCGVVKPYSEFHRAKRYEGGCKKICKECCREADRAYKAAARAEGRDREWRQRHREANHDSLVDKAAEWRAANPEKRAAHAKVQNAIRRGVLVRPDTCERCQRSGLRIEASHDDYTRPLDVEWLCVSCHRRKDVNPFTTYQEHSA